MKEEKKLTPEPGYKRDDSLPPSAQQGFHVDGKLAQEGAQAFTIPGRLLRPFSNVDFWGADREPIQKSGDEIHRVAVVAHLHNHDLRPNKLEASDGVKRARPTSKSQCERRCGEGGYCDPASQWSCGGVYCGSTRDLI